MGLYLMAIPGSHQVDGPGEFMREGLYIPPPPGSQTDERQAPSSCTGRRQEDQSTTFTAVRLLLDVQKVYSA